MKISGEGVPLMYELLSNDMEYVDFKEAQIGTEVTRSITLVNKSKIPLDVELTEAKKGEFGN